MKFKWLLVLPLAASLLLTACSPPEPKPDEESKGDSKPKVEKPELVEGVISDKPGDVASLEAGLEAGMLAPEISGEDLDGVAFNLSDYRGKVVMLDFWGDW